MAAGDLYNQLAGELRAEMRSTLAVVRASMEDQTRRDAPHVSGRTRDAIHCTDFNERFDGFVARLYADDQAAPQAKWTDQGTGEYVGQPRIVPRQARALSFFWLRIGRQMVLASVAGQPPQQWWDGPSGDRMETRLRIATDAAFGT